MLGNFEEAKKLAENTRKKVENIIKNVQFMTTSNRL